MDIGLSGPDVIKHSNYMTNCSFIPILSKNFQGIDSQLTSFTLAYIQLIANYTSDMKIIYNSLCKSHQVKLLSLVRTALLHGGFQVYKVEGLSPK